MKKVLPYILLFLSSGVIRAQATDPLEFSFLWRPHFGGGSTVNDLSVHPVTDQLHPLGGGNTHLSLMSFDMFLTDKFGISFSHSWDRSHVVLSQYPVDTQALVPGTVFVNVFPWNGAESENEKGNFRSVHHFQAGGAVKLQYGRWLLVPRLLAGISTYQVSGFRAILKPADSNLLYHDTWLPNKFKFTNFSSAAGVTLGCRMFNRIFLTAEAQLNCVWSGLNYTRTFSNRYTMESFTENISYSPGMMLMNLGLGLAVPLK